MANWRRIAAIAVVLTLLASSARAIDASSTQETREREPNPGEALAAAGLNLLYLPVRLPLTIVGAFLAGTTGFLTFGGKHAADDVFGLVDGTQVIDEHVLNGREPFCIGSIDCPRR